MFTRLRRWTEHKKKQQRRKERDLAQGEKKENIFLTIGGGGKQTSRSIPATAASHCGTGATVLRVSKKKTLGQRDKRINRENKKKERSRRSVTVRSSQEVGGENVSATIRQGKLRRGEKTPKKKIVEDGDPGMDRPPQPGKKLWSARPEPTMEKEGKRLNDRKQKRQNGKALPKRGE